MTDESRPPDADELERIEQEIRRRRGFDLAGALAGRDGGGHLKGASPTPLLQRASLQLLHWLEANLEDDEGALREVVHRTLADRPDLMARHADHPAGVLLAWLPGVLDSPAALAELVRQADVAWGQRYGERPYFERADADPDPDDPYTREDVRRKLERLLERAGG